MTPSKRVYSTRNRSRQVEAETRYDDIFSAVTRAVQDEQDFGDLSRRLIEENSMPVRMRLFSQSSHSSSEESEDDEPMSSQVPLQSSSGRPLRRAALAARNTFEVIETFEEASDEQVEQIISSAAAAVAAKAASKAAKIAKRKAEEETMRRVRALEKERKMRESAKARFSCTLCPMFYDRHLQLHKHLIEKHCGAGCGACKQSSRVLRQKHECFKCGQFAINVDTHLIEAHYAVSSRRGAVLECSRCPRTFDQLRDVLNHEKSVHGVLHRSHTRKVLPNLAPAAPRRPGAEKFHCRECGDAFDTRYVRDQHLTKHFQSVLESVWLTVEKMQEESPDRYLINQCPLCGTVMSSRKSFRAHVVHRHLMHDRDALEMLVGPGVTRMEVKEEELLTVREHIALEGRKNPADPVDLPQIPMGRVKEEVKEEESHPNEASH